VRKEAGAPAGLGNAAARAASGLPLAAIIFANEIGDWPKEAGKLAARILDENRPEKLRRSASKGRM
jgi:hypothetical protein